MARRHAEGRPALLRVRPERAPAVRVPQPAAGRVQAAGRRAGARRTAVRARHRPHGRRARRPARARRCATRVCRICGSANMCRSASSGSTRATSPAWPLGPTACPRPAVSAPPLFRVYGGSISMCRSAPSDSTRGTSRAWPPGPANRSGRGSPSWVLGSGMICKPS